MTKRVFFSFDYDRDIWRVSQVRNSQVVRAEDENDGFIDAASWEEVRRKGKDAIQNWIDEQLEGTSVTIVLIGYKTSESEWVKYEIKKSADKGNKLLGIYIHEIKDMNRQTDIKGKNPFENFTLTKRAGTKINLASIIPTYDWVSEDGRNNIAKWIESGVIPQ